MKRFRPEPRTRPAPRHRATAPTLLAVLAVASAVSAGQRPRYGGSLERVLLAPVISLDPVEATSFEELEIAAQLYATLLERDANGTLKPGLAASFAIGSGVPSKLRLELRTTATFHDGRPIDAKAVVASLGRLLDRRPSVARLLGDGARARIRTDGPRNVEIELGAEPPARWLELLAHPLSAIAAPPDGQGARAGSGPWALIGEATPTRVELQPFATFFRGRPYLDRLRYEAVTSPAEQRRALESGHWDVIDLPAALEQPAPALTLVAGAEETVFLRLNRARPTIDAGVVDALARVDRRSMVDVILKGRGLPASSLLSPRLFPPVTGLVAPPAKPTSPPPAPARLTLLYPDHDTDLALTAERIKYGLRQVLVLEPRPASLAEMRRRISAGDYDIVLDTAVASVHGLPFSLARHLGSARLPDTIPIDEADDAKLLAVLLAPPATDRVYLYHRPRRYLTRAILAGFGEDGGGPPRFENVWRALP